VGYSFKDLGSEILLVEHLLDPSVCQHLIQISESCQFADTAPILINTKDVQVRSSGILALDLANSLHKSTNDLLLSKIFVIQNLLYQHYGIQFPHAETCSILRYTPGQAYKRHVDNLLLASRMQELQQGVPTRDISIVGYLNEDFEGGETFFDRQNIKVKPQQGSAIVFPAYYTHPHQALPVTRGRKYVFTSWLYY
jgi:prolyl 4-hydroxylase